MNESDFLLKKFGNHTLQNEYHDVLQNIIAKLNLNKWTTLIFYKKIYLQN